MTKKIMVFSAYPDEIALCYGGLIANHAQTGDEVIAVTVVFPGVPVERTQDNPFGKYETEENWGNTVLRELEEIRDILGAKEVIAMKGNKLADADMLFDEDVLEQTYSLIKKYEPDIVVTHWPIGDYTDIVAVGVNVMRVTLNRKFKKRPLVYFSETLTGWHTMHFAPRIYLDITDVMEKKEKACACIREGYTKVYYDAHALPIASFRGRECGVQYAEAYAPFYGESGKQFLAGSLLDPKSRILKVDSAHSHLPAGGHAKIIVNKEVESSRTL